MNNSYKPKLQAHRGVSTDAPENTMSAFFLAVKLGYELIELDPKFTRDGVPVVLHDKTLNRTGRVNGEVLPDSLPISDITYEEASLIDVGEWFSPEYKGEKIPTLEEAIQFAVREGIELKIDNCFGKFSESEIMIFDKLIEKYATSKLVGLTFASLPMLEKYAKKFPDCPIHYDGEVTEEVLEKLRDLRIKERTTVWMRMDNALTSWCKKSPVDHIMAEKIKKDFKLGIWILGSDEEYNVSLVFEPDVIETTGGIKPKK